MPFGGNDWLALTQEPALEPDLPICDPHHHFWDKRPERTPYARYLLPELLDDIKDHNVVSTVFVEARSMYRASGPAEMKPVGEVTKPNPVRPTRPPYRRRTTTLSVNPRPTSRV